MNFKANRNTNGYCFQFLGTDLWLLWDPNWLCDEPARTVVVIAMGPVVGVAAVAVAESRLPMIVEDFD